MKSEIKSIESLITKLTKTYDSKPHQTIGTIIVSLELILKQLIKLNDE